MAEAAAAGGSHAVPSKKVQVALQLHGVSASSEVQVPRWLSRNHQDARNTNFIAQCDIGYSVKDQPSEQRTPDSRASSPSTSSTSSLNSRQSSSSQQSKSLRRFCLSQLARAPTNQARSISVYLLDSGVDTNRIRSIYPEVQVALHRVLEEQHTDFTDLGVDDDSNHGTQMAMAILEVLGPAIHKGIPVTLHSWKVLDSYNRGFLSLLDPALRQVSFHMARNPASHVCLNMSFALDEKDIDEKDVVDDTLSIKSTLAAICSRDGNRWIAVAAGNRAAGEFDLASPARFVRDPELHRYSSLIVVRAAYAGEAHQLQTLLEQSRRCEKTGSFCRCVAAPGHRIVINGLTTEVFGTSVATAIVSGFLLAHCNKPSEQTHIRLSSWFNSDQRFFRVESPSCDARGRTPSTTQPSPVRVAPQPRARSPLIAVASPERECSTPVARQRSPEPQSQTRSSPPTSDLQSQLNSTGDSPASAAAKGKAHDDVEREEPERRREESKKPAPCCLIV